MTYELLHQYLYTLMVILLIVAFAEMELYAILLPEDKEQEPTKEEKDSTLTR